MFFQYLDKYFLTIYFIIKINIFTVLIYFLLKFWKINYFIIKIIYFNIIVKISK